MYARHSPNPRRRFPCKQSSLRMILQKVLTAARPRGGHVSLVVADRAE